MTTTPNDAEWAQIAIEEAKRATIRAEAQMAHQKRQQQWRIERSRKILEGVGFALGGLLIVGVILGIVFAIYRTGIEDRDRSVKLEQERTAQVQICVGLEDPTERTMCLLAINREDQ